MPFKITQVADFAEQVRGVTYSKGDASSNPRDGYIPILRANNITENGLSFENVVYVPEGKVSKKQRLIPGDIVVAASSGSLEVVGKAAEFTNGFEGSFGAFCKVVRPSGEIFPPYLAHFFKTDKYRKTISALASGANINNLRNEHISSLELPLPFKNGKPDLDEQKRIAAILDKADAIRRKRRQALQLTDDFLRSLFLDMFGDPVTNPKGIPMGCLGDLVERLDGGKNIAESNTPTSYRVLKVSAVTSGKYRADESKFVPAYFQVPSAYIVNAGDLLVSRANTRELIGATAYVWDTPKNIMLPDKIWKFVWRDPEAVDPLFVHALTRVPGIQAEIGKRASGTSGSMKNIAKPKLIGLPIPIPSPDEQFKFGDIARRIQKMSHKIVGADASPDCLFAALQHRAFKGEL